MKVGSGVTMNAMSKVLVVDTGRRGDADLLSTELAELGLASVTTSFEAASEVLHMIQRPSAIVLRMPLAREAVYRDSFVRLAAELRADERALGIPVIEWEPDASLAPGGISALLRSEVGPQAVAGPET